MLNSGPWQRVSKAQPCPVCDKPDWCLLAGPEDSPTAAICARIESDQRAGEAGWLHQLRDDDAWEPRRRRYVRTDTLKSTRIDFERFARDGQSAARLDRLTEFARSLELSMASLRRLRVGWSECHRAWTFPMTDAEGNVVGIRLRLSNGRKLSVKGGREGLFLPDDVEDDERLLITEGPTDCTALLDLGFTAVGRPSCRGGSRLLVELIRRWQPSEIVIVADDDQPGLLGANDLASVVTAYARSVRVVTPPLGVKDAREWKQRGATHDDVLARIAETESQRLGLVAVKLDQHRRKAGKQ